MEEDSLGTLIRTSNDTSGSIAREWQNPTTSPQRDMFTHYVNPSVTTCGTANTAYAYTANSLGLTDSTQA